VKRVVFTHRGVTFVQVLVPDSWRTGGGGSVYTNGPIASVSMKANVVIKPVSTSHESLKKMCRKSVRNYGPI